MTANEWSEAGGSRSLRGRMRSRFVVAFCVGFGVSFLDGCGPNVKPCSASTCQGCCDANGECLAGSAVFECGAGGNACQRCEANQACHEGHCALFAEGDYDASFPERPGETYNPDAGIFRPSDGGNPDAGIGRGDAGAGVVSFAIDVAPIFSAHCNGCHNWDSVVTMKKNATAGDCTGSPRIVAGRTDAGVLLSKISGTPICGATMPQGQSALIVTHPDDVETIRRWVLQGALDN